MIKSSWVLICDNCMKKEEEPSDCIQMEIEIFGPTLPNRQKRVTKDYCSSCRGAALSHIIQVFDNDQWDVFKVLIKERPIKP